MTLEAAESQKRGRERWETEQVMRKRGWRERAAETNLADDQANIGQTFMAPRITDTRAYNTNTAESIYTL